jgi:2-polyprenyl-3-methyl-5-hydroxy-6-metoxy-1,4-benzoquinol methylase
MSDIKNYWRRKVRKNDPYFLKQLKNPKYSTIDFFKFLQKNKIEKSSILDLACGNGANLIYLKKKYKNHKECLGIDFNKDLINQAQKISKKNLNLSFKKGNIEKLPKNIRNKFEGVTCLQTLSWLKDYKKTINEIKKLNPKFIAISSLFWEGLIDFNIKVNFLKSKSYKREIDSYNYYNIYSLKNYLDFLKKHGYKKNIIKKFEIKKSLKEPTNKNIMGTYTVPYKNKLNQVSGPIVQNWYFIISKKK